MQICNFGLVMVLFLVYSQAGLADKYDDVVEKALQNSIAAEAEQEAFDRYLARAEAGDAWSQGKVAYLYYTGKGVTQHFEQAAHWYKKSAEQGSAYAQNALAGMYLRGEGVEQSDELALGWYMKSAEQGYEGAEVSLGYLYDVGKGVAKNYDKAVYWYTKAAEKGNLYAQKSLAMVYFNPGVQQSFSKTTVSWEGSFSFDSLFGNEPIKKTVTHDPNGTKLNQPVKGVNWDYKKAYVWSSIAAMNGDTEASGLRDSIAIILYKETLDEAAIEISALQKLIEKNKAVQAN